MRPANLVTAVADIMAGAAIAGFLSDLDGLVWLVLATLGLYGGGVVLNDVFDAHLDAVERPERPIPSGRVPLRHAALLGAGLLICGVAAAAFFSFKAVSLLSVSRLLRFSITGLPNITGFLGLW